jgi:hypothetical protein
MFSCAGIPYSGTGESLQLAPYPEEVAMKAQWFLSAILIAVLLGTLFPTLALGSQPGVEDVSRRDMMSRHYRLPDGSIQAEISLLPIHYMDGNGAWRPIDLSFVPCGRKGEFANLKNPLRSSSLYLRETGLPALTRKISRRKAHGVPRHAPFSCPGPAS